MRFLIWPDGSITTGDTWREVEDALRSSQWCTYATRRAFRRAMKHRAEVWSGNGNAIPTRRGTTSAQFIAGLVQAGLCRCDGVDPNEH